MKKKTSIKSRFYHGCILTMFVLILSVIFIACNGDDDSSSGSSGLAYSGVTDPALITDTNARDIAVSAYTNGARGAAFSGIAAVQTPVWDNLPVPFMLDIADLFNNAIGKLNGREFNAAPISAAIISKSDSIAGNCGGSAAFTISANDQTGEFTGNISFQGYCNDGATISGSATLSGRVNLSTEEIQNFVITFNSITGTSGSESFTMSGTFSAVNSGSGGSFTMNMLVKDNMTSEVFQIKDYSVNVTEYSNYASITVSGVFYYPDYGYVTLSTQSPLKISTNSVYPYEGTMIATGANGAAGGPTAAKLVVISASTYQVVADTDGDGMYDNYDSGVLNWSAL